MATGYIGIVLLVLLFLAWVTTFEFMKNRRLRRLMSSPCDAVRLWCRAFPESSKQDIRLFLDAALLAFALAKRHRFRLAPEAKLMDLYRAVEPHAALMSVDGEELEDLTAEIEKRFGVDISEHVGEEVTLGELFALTQSNSR